MSVDIFLPKTCWVVTEGKAGMENQCLGLAAALGVDPVVKRIKLRTPWKQLSPFLRQGLSYALSTSGDDASPPWPDILIASGRASVPTALLAHRAIRPENAPSTFTIYIQNPIIDPSRFDLVVVPRHDQLLGPNVVTTRGSLHRVTSDLLAREAERFLPTVAHLPRPLYAVSIGGSNSVYTLSTDIMRDIASKLATLARDAGSLMITTSRRTGAENLAILQHALQGTNAFIWDGQGPNPYYGMLGLAEAILVTCDSVNMISEACSTGKPAMVIDLPGGSDKFRRFHQAMRDDGLIKPFQGRIEKWHYPPLDDVRLVATRVKEMMGYLNS